MTNVFETLASTFVNKQLARPEIMPPATPRPDRSVWKGIVAGMVAGAVATAAKSLVEQVYPPRTHGEPEPPAVLAEKVAGHELAPATKETATELIHWTFGISAGAAYGALAEYYPAATSREGVNFGMTLMALTHQSALPAMGLSATPPAQTSREKTSEIASHVAYGLVAETVRGMVRKML